MGCCLGTGHEHGHCSGTTSPASTEEEAVKEVLLETPFIFSQLSAAGETVSKENNIIDAAASATPPSFHAGSPKVFPGGISPDVSEISELYSYSNIDGFSDTAALERRGEEGDGDVNQRTLLKQRRAFSGGSRRVPARATPSPSPEKRSQVMPSRQVRNANGQLPHVGSVRRSRSPMARGEVGDRLGMSVAGEIAAGETVDVELDDDVETLENPIVSLECFIFL